MPHIEFNDTRLHVTHQGSGPPLLLVHGFPLDHRMWRGQLEGLSDRYTVIAPDLRGFGDSKVTEGTVTMEQYADDLATLLEVLEIDQPVAFCGLSMGGYVGWQFWNRHRAKLACLIACDTRAIADSADAAHNRRATAESVLTGGLQELVGGMLPKLFAETTRQQQAELVKATEQSMLSAPRHGVAAALRGMAQRVDVTTWLAQIDLPTLVLCGSQDSIASPEEMQGIAAAIKGSRFVEIEQAGHLAPLEQSEVVNQVLAEFLADVFAG